MFSIIGLVFFGMHTTIVFEQEKVTEMEEEKSRFVSEEDVAAHQTLHAVEKNNRRRRKCHQTRHRRDRKEMENSNNTKTNTRRRRHLLHLSQQKHAPPLRKATLMSFFLSPFPLFSLPFLCLPKTLNERSDMKQRTGEGALVSKHDMGQSVARAAHPLYPCQPASWHLPSFGPSGPPRPLGCCLFC